MVERVTFYVDNNLHHSTTNFKLTHSQQDSNQHFNKSEVVIPSKFFQSRHTRDDLHESSDSLLNDTSTTVPKGPSISFKPYCHKTTTGVQLH